jgi:uncharacterized membrane protein YdjX (TVP38/TMEM64 family)
MKIWKKTQLFKASLFILFLGCLTWITVYYYSGIITVISNPDKFRQLLISYGSLSILVFICFQISMVILAPLPGELLLIAGGYIYGTLFGAIYSLIGIFLGSIIVFGISKFFGYFIIRSLISPKKFARLHSLVNHQKSDLTIFLLYLIPEMPKDILTYLAGLTPVKPVRFIVFSTIARVPCIIGSSFIGANLQQKNYWPVIILLIAVSILLMAIFLMRAKIVRKFNSFIKSGNCGKKIVMAIRNHR